MRQFASQLLSFFLSPAVWILLLIILSYVFKTTGVRKKCRWAALVIFLLFSNQWLLDSYAKWWQPKPRNVAADSAYSCGILLGGFGSPDARDASGYFNASADRFIQALKLYKTGKIQHIIISGGNGKKDVKEFSEGEWARNEMEVMGVAPEAILYEDRSRNTAGNAEYTKKLLDTANLKPPYLLITSAFHMPRASLIYRQAGIPVVPFPCNYMQGRGKFGIGDLVPDPNVLSQWNPFLKEAAGWLLYRVKGK